MKRGEEDRGTREKLAGADERFIKRRRESERDGGDDDNCFARCERMCEGGCLLESGWLEVM